MSPYCYCGRTNCEHEKPKKKKKANDKTWDDVPSGNINAEDESPEYN